MDEKSVDELYQHALDLLYKDRRPMAALDEADGLLTQERSGRMWSLKAAALSALNRIEEAVATLQEAIGYGSSDYPIHQQLMELLVTLGRFDEAQAEYQKALEALTTVSQNEAFKQVLAGPQAGSLAVAYVDTRAQVLVRGTQIANLKYMTEMRQALDKRVQGVEQQLDKGVSVNRLT